MPRKPEPSFRLKQLIWDMAATIGAENLNAFQKDLDYRLERLRQDMNETFSEVTPDTRTIKRILRSDIQRLTREVVVTELPRHVWRLRNDYAEIENLAKSMETQRKSAAEIGDKQNPYQETPHRQEIRSLAKDLGQRIGFPSLHDKALVNDAPVEFNAGEYQTLLGNVSVHGDQIKVSYFDAISGLAAPHLVESLCGHLRTSGVPEFAGIEGRIRGLATKAGQESEALLRLLKLMADEVKSYRAKVSFGDDVKPGLTKFFTTMAWKDAVDRATGYVWIDERWYQVEPYKPGTPGAGWQLKCGAWIIGIADSRRRLTTYQLWHERLRTKYATDPLAKGIAASHKEMGEIAPDIKRRLDEFSDMQYLPGRCKLC